MYITTSDGLLATNSVPAPRKYKERSLKNSGLVGGLVGCFRFNCPLRQYFSLYRAVFQREGERGEKS